MKKIEIFLAFSFLFLSTAYGREYAFKTNALYWATLTPNLGFEIGLYKKITYYIYSGYNWLELKKHTRWKHYLVHSELRYWLREKFRGHFLGVYGGFGKYDMYNTPILTPKEDRSRLYKGTFGFVGISYGYQWVLSKHWNLEATLGFGYVRTPYSIYGDAYGKDYLGSRAEDMFLPSTGGISIIYFIK